MTSKEMLKALAFPTENTKHDRAEKCWQEDQGWVCRGWKSRVPRISAFGALSVRNNISRLLSCLPLLYSNIKKPGMIKYVRSNWKWVEIASFYVEYLVSSLMPLSSFSLCLSRLRRSGSLRYPWVFREIVRDRRLDVLTYQKYHITTGSVVSHWMWKIH